MASASDNITYDASKFNPQPSSEFLCAICHCVLYEPRMCACRHIFCKACIETWLYRSSTCPTCRSHTTLRLLQLAPPLVQSVLNSLTMDCDNKDRGCTYPVPMEHFPSHIAHCDFRAVDCPHPGCKIELTAGELARHKEECQYRTEHCRKECRLPFPAYKLDTHDCTTAMRDRVDELNSIVHRHQVVLKWLRSKLNAMFMPQQSQSVQLHSFHETLDDINHFWPPEQPIPLRLCGSYIASAPSSSATSTSQTSAAEVSSETSTHSGNSILERLVLEASAPQAQRRHVFAPRYQDEADGPTTHIRRDYPVRGIVRDFDTHINHSPPETPTSPSREPLNLLSESLLTNPLHIPLESLRPHTHFVHRVLPNPQVPSLGTAQSGPSQPQPQRTSPANPQGVSPTAFRSRVRSSRDRSPTPFPDPFRTERDDDRLYQSADTTDDDITPYSSPPYSEEYAPPRTYNDARRNDYDMYWSYWNRRIADSGDSSLQYLPTANENRGRSPSYYSRSRSRSSRSRSGSIYTTISRSGSRSRSRSHSGSVDSRPRSSSPQGADRSRNQFRSRSRSDWRLEQVNSPLISALHSRSHSISPSRRTNLSRSQTRSQRPRRSRSNSSSRRLSRSRSRSRARRSRRRSQSWNHEQSRSHSGSYHSSDPNTRYSDNDSSSSSNWEGSMWDDINGNDQSSEERGHWTPDQNHTNDTHDDNSNDRHHSWHLNITSESQSRNEGYQSSGGSSRGSRHSASGSSTSPTHETPSGGSQQLHERTSDDSSNVASCVWVAPKSPDFSQGDGNWSVPTGTDELSDQESQNWHASDSETGERDDRSSPPQEQVTRCTHLSQDGCLASDQSEGRQTSHHTSPLEAASSLDLSSSSDSSKASAWHARSAQSSKKSKRESSEDEVGKDSGQQPGCCSEAKSKSSPFSSKKDNEDEQKQGDTTQASSGVRNSLDQEASKNVWESSSDTTLLDYDLPDEEASSALSPKPHSGIAHNSTSSSHDEVCSGQDKADPTHSQTNAQDATENAEGSSPVKKQSRSEGQQNSRETGNQLACGRGEQSSYRHSDSDKEESSKGRKGKSKKDYKGKGKALLKSKKSSASRRVLDSDSDRNSGSDSNLKQKAKVRQYPILSSSESSDTEKTTKTDGGQISIVMVNGAAGAPSFPSTSHTVLAPSTNTSTMKEEVGNKKIEKSRKRDSACTNQIDEKHSHSQDRHSKKRKANKNRQSETHKKPRLSDRTTATEHEGGLRSYQSTNDVRQNSTHPHYQRHSYPQLKRHSQASATASSQSSLHSFHATGTTSSQRTVTASLELGQSENRPRPETLSVDRTRSETDPSSRASAEALARQRRRGMEGMGVSSRPSRASETNSVGENTPFSRIMRVERMERGGGRAPPTDTHSRRIMRVENSSGRSGISPRSESGESLRMVRIPDLPVPPSTLDLLNQYAYTENNTDDSDSTWSPSSSDEL